MESRKWFNDSRWLSMGVDDDGALYYIDKESTWKDGDGIKVEIRAIPLQGNNQSGIATGASYICQLWKIYPNKSTFDLLSFRSYDSKDQPFSFVPHYQATEIEIKPGSVAEKIKTKVCADKAIKGTAKSSKEEFSRQRGEALGHETFPFLTGTTWIVAIIVILVVGIYLNFHFYNAGMETGYKKGRIAGWNTGYKEGQESMLPLIKEMQTRGSINTDQSDINRKLFDIEMKLDDAEWQRRLEVK